MSEAPKTTSLPLQYDARDAKPVLSVISADSSGAGESGRRSEQLSPQMTLGDFYSAYVLPVCRRSKGNDAKTIVVDRTALRYWARFTRDPALEEIDEYDLSDFVAGRASMEIAKGPRKGEPVSANTVRKDCRHLQFILDRAGPRTRKRRNAARLIPEPPGFEPPEETTDGEPQLIPLNEIGDWLSVCRHADTPTHCRIKPDAWWRGLIIFAYNTALRIDTLMQLEWSMLDAEGWLDVPKRIFKGKRHGGKFYVNTAAREAIEPFRHHRYDRIFPWYEWPSSKSWLHEKRRDLWTLAHIHRPGNGFHGLRRSVLTWLGGKNRLVADFVAGHVRGNDILASHYIDHKQIVPELVEQVPQPIWSANGDYRQRSLPGFDMI